MTSADYIEPGTYRDHRGSMIIVTGPTSIGLYAVVYPGLEDVSTVLSAETIRQLYPMRVSLSAAERAEIDPVDNRAYDWTAFEKQLAATRSELSAIQSAGPHAELQDGAAISMVRRALFAAVGPARTV